MSIRSTAKKTIWVIFALGGLGLGIGLTATGIFAPFGVTVLGLVGAGVLLFLAMLGVAALLIMAMKLISKTINIPTSDDISTINRSSNVIPQSSSQNTISTKVHASPLPETKPVQQRSKEQLKQHAEEVKTYLVQAFQLGGELYMNIFIGDRISEHLSILAKDNLSVVETDNTNYKLVLSSSNYFCSSTFFTSQTVRKAFFDNPKNKGKLLSSEIDPNPNDPMSTCKERLRNVAEKIKEKCGPGTAAITFTKHKSFDQEEPYYYQYQVEIFPEKIQLPTNQTNPEKRL